MRYLLCLLLPLYFLFALNIEDNTPYYEKFTINHFYDPDHTLDIETITQQKFEETSSQFAFGYHEGTRWFKLTFVNHSQNSDFILSFSDPLWKEFTLYTPGENGWKSSPAGLLTPLSQREVKSIAPSFALHLLPNESSTVYLKGVSSSGQLGAFTLFTEEEFFRPTRLTLKDIYLFFILFLVIVLVFNLYLYITRLERLYLFYIFYVGSLLVWFMVKSGLYLCFDINGWDEGLHTTGALLVSLLVLFSREVFQLKQRFSRVDKAFLGFMLIFFIFVVLIALDVPHTPLLFNIISSVFFTLLLITSIYVWRDGNFQMPYYIIALVIFMPTMGMLTLTYNGFIPYHPFSRYAFLFGSFSEVILFNSLMISHYNIMFKDKIRMQGEIITLKESKENALEDEIKLYIKELEDANDELLTKTKELESFQRKLEIAATTDPLSNLWNRRYIQGISERVFDTAKRYNQALSIVMIDIDDFKRINDTYGHTQGDDVIVSCANILKENSRKTDTLARYGGEEFLIYLPNTTHDKVEEFTARIQKAAENDTIRTAEGPLNYTISVGFSHMHANDTNIEDIIQRADKAMYLAKSHGKNCIKSL